MSEHELADALPEPTPSELEVRAPITPRILRQLADELECEPEVTLSGALTPPGPFGADEDAVTVILYHLPDLDAPPCERCSRPIPLGRLEAVLDAKLCVDCQRHAERMRGRPEVDDLRPRREGLPEALRRVEPLWEGD